MTERKVTVLRAQLTNERPTSVERQLAMAQQITHEQENPGPQKCEMAKARSSENDRASP